MPEKVKTDQLQPMTEIQAQQARDYVKRLAKGSVSFWDAGKEGDERTFELSVTPELVVLYADGVEDYNPWYEAWGMYGGPKGESPFGPAIAPPLLPSQQAYAIQVDTTKPFPVGGIHVYHNSEILEPIPIGTKLRFRGKLTKKFIKRDRRYIRTEITVEDAKTGKLLFKETREVLCAYKKV